MNRLVFDQLGPGPDDDLLEIGFGGGELLGWLRRASRGRVIGADVSAEAVARTRRRFGGEIELFEASVEALPIPAASVDKACSVNNIYFWPDPHAGLAELARVIRPGGRLCVAFEPPEELSKWPGHRFGFRAYEVEAVATMLVAAGFGTPSVTEGHGRKPDRFVCLTAARAGAEAAQ